MSSSSSRRRIIRDERYLFPSYTPEQPVGREDIVERMTIAMEPVAHRRVPENVLLYGPAGTGKTTLANHVVAKLEAATRVTTAFVNCWQYNTRPALLAELLIQLGFPAPRKGKPTDELLSKLREWLEKHHGVVAVLDEIDQLRHLTEIVYDLHHTSATAATGLGLLLISNQVSMGERLDARSESRLHHHAVYVPPYDAEELLSILSARAEGAFQPGAVPDEVLHRIADIVAEQSGDCRRALRLLLRVGRLAEHLEAPTVNLDHLSQVRG